MAARIIWIHGFPLSSEVFRHQRDIEGAAHLMPDLPGFGSARDARSTPVTIEDYARYVLSAFEGEAIFAGLSMGGYICLSIARIAPQRMRGLILIDTRETADTPEARQGRFDTIAKVESDGIEPVVTSMLPKMLTASAGAEQVAQVRSIMESSSRAGVIAALRAMAVREDSTMLLRRVEVPALVVAGSDDPITPPADAERMARLLPQASLAIIPGAAHLSNFEKPEEFNRAVMSWLATFG